MDLVRGNKNTLGAQNDIPPTIALANASQIFFIVSPELLYAARAPDQRRW
jgi:hypothetical protein